MSIGIIRKNGDGPMTSPKENVQERKKSAGTSGSNYRRLFEDTPGGYFVLDRDGAVQEVNRAGLSLLGWKRGRVVGKTFVDFVDQDDRRHFSIHLYEVTRSAQASMCELTLVGKNGRRCLVELCSAPALDSTGKRVMGCLSVIVDAAERREREARLRGLFTEAERRHQQDAADLNRSGALLQQEVF